MATLLLVPTPLAASRAARRLCDAEGGVLFGPQVATFDRLVPGLLAAAGDRRAVLSLLAEAIVAAEAGRAAGGPFAEVAPGRGLGPALARALRELRAAEVPSGAARAAACRLAGAPAARLGALAEALAACEARLEALGALDGPAALRAAAAAARRGVRSAETDGLELLVLHGFHALGPAERELASALAARARRTRVHVPFHPGRADACAPAEPLLRWLEGHHELSRTRDVEVVLPDDLARGAAGALAAWFAAGPGPAAGDPPGGDVEAIPGAGEEGEAEAAAAAAAALVERGIPAGEVAVVVPSPARAAPALARAFAAAGVPLAVGRGAPLLEAEVARTVLAALAAAGRAPREALERLAASPYLGAGLPPARLRALLDRAGTLDGRAEPAGALRARAASLGPGGARERAALLAAADALDGLRARLAPLASPGTAREHARRLGALVEGAGIRRRAARGPREAVVRDLAALGRLEEAAEAVVRGVALAGRGAEPLPADGFAALLELAAAGAALPAAGEPAAGAVELWGLDEAPGLAARAVVLAGCGRGGFPPAVPADALLRDPERRALNEVLGRSALPTSAARRAEAAYLAFSALAAGREALRIVWAAPGPAGDGAPLAPALAEALDLAGVPVPAAPAEPGPARSARAALRRVVRGARAGDGAPLPSGAAPAGGLPGVEPAAAGGALPPALAARAADALARGEAEAARAAAVRARAPAPFAGAVEGAGLEALRAALPAEWSPTALEGFARCPFRALLRLGVNLPDPDAEGLDPDPRDEGRLLHAALERFVRGRIARGAWPLAGGDEDLAEADAAASAVLARFEGDGRTGDPAVWAARREAVRGRLLRAVRAEADAADGLVPALLEHAFGADAPHPALVLDGPGGEVRVRGRIDRVDASPGRLRVVDYKSGAARAEHREKLDPEAFGVTSFQIPLYLAAAARDLPGRAGGEATYVLLRSGERLAPHVADLAALGDGGAERARLAAAVAGVVARVRAGAFPIASQGCAGCPSGAVCRFEGEAAREEAEG